jgi:hypothetical protein
MRFLEYLTEEFKCSIKDFKGRLIEIFNFPDKSELRGINKARFIIDFNKEKFYIWNGESMIIHADVFKRLKITQNSAAIFGLGKYDIKKHKILLFKDDDDNLYTFYDINKLEKMFYSNFFIKVLSYFSVDKRKFMNAILPEKFIQEEVCINENIQTWPEFKTLIHVARSPEDKKYYEKWI